MEQFNTLIKDLYSRIYYIKSLL